MLCSDRDSLNQSSDFVDCPSDEQLAAFIDNALEQSARDLVLEHVQHCARLL